MVPSSVEKSRVAGALRPLTVITKPDVVLLTTPLGVEVAPDGLPAGGGMMMSAPLFSPSASNRMALPEPLAATRNSPAEVSENPHGLVRFRSLFGANPGMSETSGVWTYPELSRQRSSRHSTLRQQEGRRPDDLASDACRNLRNQVRITVSLRLKTRAQHLRPMEQLLSIVYFSKSHQV